MLSFHQAWFIAGLHNWNKKYDYYEFVARQILLQYRADKRHEREFNMFVQVAVRNGESAQIRDRIVRVVQMAMQEALGIDATRTFVRLALAADEPKGIQPCR